MNYSQSDIDFMRKDAIRRTREMHSNAVKMNSNVQAEQLPPPQGKCPEKTENEKNKSNSPLNFLSGMFSGGKIDNDKLIIIMLIIILAKEGADLKLLIALGYILM